MGIVFIDCRTISWGAANEDDSNNVWQVEDGSNDPGEIVLKNYGSVGTPVGGFPADATIHFGGSTYSFVFWNASNGLNAVDGYPSTAENLVLPNLSGVFHATAWYAVPGGPGHGTPALRARTFDIDVNNFRKETPIHSATPGGAWPGPNNHSVSTQSADATATAKNSLTYPEPVSSQPPGTLRRRQVLNLLQEVLLPLKPSPDRLVDGHRRAGQSPLEDGPCQGHARLLAPAGLREELVDVAGDGFVEVVLLHGQLECNRVRMPVREQPAALLRRHWPENWTGSCAKPVAPARYR